MRHLLLLAVLALSGCGLFRPTFESCDETPAYAGARELPPLAVPEGVDGPDTRNALRIPAVTTPERPRDGRCIDAPPSYQANRTAAPAG
jgi:uncharacterized lipoprotein